MVVGIIDAWPDGAYQAGFALNPDPESPTFVGRSPFAERDTGQFRMFLNWEGNPLRSSNPVEFLVTWNAEVDAPESLYPLSGPISISWDRFWDRLVGEDFPMPGSVEWWANTPPQCCSLMDAPDGVLDPLPFGEVWVRVPDSWRGLVDGALCLRISFGSTGCIGLHVRQPSIPQPIWPYLYLDEVYAVPGESIQINVSRIRDGAISRVDEVTIGLIPFTTFIQTSNVLVELDASFSRQSYQDVVANPLRSNLATTRSMSSAEEETLLAERAAFECSADPNC